MKPIRDIIPALPDESPIPELTRSQSLLLEAAQSIADSPDAAELAFLARQLILCTLPHSDPGNALPVWTRKTGIMTLGIQPGVDLKTERTIGYPYGTIPRLVLFWICTEIQRTKQSPDATLLDRRTLTLGNSLGAWMREIGLNPATGGGKRGDAKRLHDQMDRLFAAHISFQQPADPKGTGKRWQNMEVTTSGELWWHPRSAPAQGTLWRSWITLGEAFYTALLEAPVPIDTRALRALKRSPLALDLYAWICYRAYVIVTRKQTPKFMAWAQLYKQLGTELRTVKNFKQKCQAAMRKILPLYPGLDIQFVPGGFTVYADRLAVQSEKGDKGETFPR